MKRQIVIGNWKMKLSVAQSVQLANQLKTFQPRGIDVALCPSFISLPLVAEALRSTRWQIGAQDVFWENSGAYTGEVSAAELTEIGCKLVLVGHSERREHLMETDDMIHRKVIAALGAGLTPVVCVGETHQQREEGGADYAIIDQVTKALQGISLQSDQELIIAYEPIWVIGSGQAIDPQKAGEMHQVIRQTLLDLFSLDTVDEKIRIIYGGSVNQTNVAAFCDQPHVNGVLVGGASLQAGEFTHIINAI